jgi:hypothetical protein
MGQGDPGSAHQRALMPLRAACSAKSLREGRGARWSDQERLRAAVGTNVPLSRFYPHENTRRRLQPGFAGRGHAVHTGHRRRGDVAATGLGRGQDHALNEEAIHRPYRPDPGARGRSALRAQHPSARAIGQTTSLQISLLQFESRGISRPAPDIARWLVALSHRRGERGAGVTLLPPRA